MYILYLQNWCYSILSHTRELSRPSSTAGAILYALYCWCPKFTIANSATFLSAQLYIVAGCSAIHRRAVERDSLHPRRSYICASYVESRWCRNHKFEKRRTAKLRRGTRPTRSQVASSLADQSHSDHSEKIMKNTPPCANSVIFGRT